MRRASGTYQPPAPYTEFTPSRASPTVLSAVCCLLSAICCLLSAICYLLFAVCCLLSATSPTCRVHSILAITNGPVCCLLSAICCLLSAVCFLLSAFYCLLSAVCFQLYTQTLLQPGPRSFTFGVREWRLWCTTFMVLEIDGNVVREQRLWCQRVTVVMLQSDGHGVRE
jgi:hypothetical protein